VVRVQVNTTPTRPPPGATSGASWSIWFPAPTSSPPRPWTWPATPTSSGQAEHYLPGQFPVDRHYNGVGSVTSAGGATNGATLFLNQTYTLTAAVLPKTNWLFDIGAAARPTWAPPTAELPHEQQFGLTANFVTNRSRPWPDLQRPLLSRRCVEPSNAGFFSATLVSNGAGAYTAQLMLNGATYHNPPACSPPPASPVEHPAAGGASVSVP